ncbi:VQ motif-containing protein [Corchorus capsularis]|uniref:VQ motif-containing protein n=1 Tax=Corchorus capsularis TaxID=210143 RepID=A0A1R3JGV6_COCAP|nr:VQ motif-containing protein [Corchorus capsularis]
MDVLGVRQMKTSHKKNSRRSNSKKDFKVVYISSPMKFKTCASEFRALVQELTGKDSDVALRFMDSDGSSTENSPANSEVTRVVDDRDIGLPMTNSSNHHQSPFEPFDDGLMSEGSFLGMFTSNLFQDASQFDDAIRSFNLTN